MEEDKEEHHNGGDYSIAKGKIKRTAIRKSNGRMGVNAISEEENRVGGAL